MKRFWSKVNVRPLGQPGCWDWQGAIKPNGYGWFSLNDQPMNAHRMAYILAVGEIPSGKCVCHRCDNRKCVRPDHLWLGTPSENLKDMWRKGRGVSNPSPNRGAKNYQAKLTEEKVAFIRANRGKLSQRALAARFGVSQATVYEAQNGLTWKEGVLSLEK